MTLPSVPSIPAFHRRLATCAEPLALFEALYGGEPLAFLYESLEAHGQRGRYSFIGARPRAVFRSTGDALELDLAGKTHHARGNPLDALRQLIRPQLDAPPVAPFCGGAVGYLGYDVVRQIERLPDNRPDGAGVPDAWFLVPREVVCFDHLEKVIHVILYDESGHEARLTEIRRACDATGPAAVREQALHAQPGAGAVGAGGELSVRSNMARPQFEAMVERAREYIRAGDVFQVVLSQRFEFEAAAPPLAYYRALRETNPSPYMYYLRLSDLHIAGSSPEVLVGLTGRRVLTRPLAGTRPRGATEEEDLALARELRADPKEQAEHVMLVDLGRNDLGRVCEGGSVRVSDVMEIERHSRVMHLVSSVEGWLREDCDAVDVFRATFPAGTVSGAPKIRAMQVIDELEPQRRGVYAGAIGYFSYLGDMDLCIAIRTMVLHRGRGHIQAGAGVVADSVAAREYEETLNKANALLRAARLARER
ncbi:MAG: anthranilate synthase component I [Phycisphaerae bacterium]|nr:anthranilate synthase component I [Phycisphaerae bacterium]MCZ2401240.1 anthranilate synthase component I [Phycisphaerae bacterium]